RQPVRQRAGYDNPARTEFAVGQVEDFPCDVVEIDRLKYGWVLAQQRAQPIDHSRSTFVVFDDVVECQLQLAVVQRLPVEQLSRGLRIEKHGRERLAQLVRECAGQLAQRGDA